MIKANLQYEQAAIDDYTEHMKKIGQNDPVTYNLLQGILAQEEEHAHDLSAWLGQQEISFNLRAVGGS
jgi:bacterioferritin